MTSIDCQTKQDDPIDMSGVLTEGFLRFFYRDGDLTVNDVEMDLMGDSVWISQGALMNFTMSEGFTYVVGGPFVIDSEADEFMFSSSYGAPKFRTYMGRDAVENIDAGNGLPTNCHDDHIGNGTTNARDLTYSKGLESIDPPSVTVMNCAPVEDSYVWYHLHPFGTVYMPFSGSICFQSSESLCITLGEARWVSANLFYHETFVKIEEDNEKANELIDLAFTAENATACTYPIVFAVTNFDPDNEHGVPNFVDMPNGPAKWGIWDTMTIRSTSITAKKSVVVDMDAQYVE